MKFFIINSFRFLVYNAYFGIIALYTFGVFLERQQIQGVISQFTTSGKVLVERGMVDPQTGLIAMEPMMDRGMVLSDPSLSALSIVIGLLAWLATPSDWRVGVGTLALALVALNYWAFRSDPRPAEAQ